MLFTPRHSCDMSQPCQLETVMQTEVRFRMNMRWRVDGSANLQALDLLAHAIAVFKRVMSPTRSNSEKPSWPFHWREKNMRQLVQWCRSVTPWVEYSLPSLLETLMTWKELPHNGPNGSIPPIPPCRKRLLTSRWTTIASRSQVRNLSVGTNVLLSSGISGRLAAFLCEEQWEADWGQQTTSSNTHKTPALTILSTTCPAVCWMVLRCNVYVCI